MVSWWKRVQNIQLFTELFCLRACDKNLLFICFKTAWLKTIHEFLTLPVLSNGATFVYKASCIFPGKARRPAGRRSRPSSLGRSPAGPGTWSDGRRGPRWRCGLLFYRSVWYTWMVTKISGSKLSLTDNHLSVFDKASKVIILWWDKDFFLLGNLVISFEIISSHSTTT